MMQIRCQWCGWTYTMARETLLYAVAKAQAEKAIHHVENCPKCRHALKIQVSELKRRIPPNTPLPEYVPPAPVEVAPPPAKPAPAASTPAPEPAKEIVEVKESAESKKTKETVEIKEKKVPPKKVEEVKPKKVATKTKTVEKKTTSKKK